MTAILFPLRRILAAFLIATGLVIAASPASAFEDDYFRVVDLAPGDLLTLRAQPRASARVLGAIPDYAQGIEHLASGAGSYWALVRYRGVQGWVKKRHLIEQVAQGSIPGYDVYELTRVTRVASNDVLNVRAWPSARSRKVAELAPDAAGIIVVRRHANGWALVTYDGSRGWVNARFLAALRY